MNVTKLQNKNSNYHYEEDELYELQMQQNSKSASNKYTGAEKEGAFSIIHNWYPCLASGAGLYAGITYLFYFNFASGLIRLIFLGILCLYPIICLCFNCIVGNSMRRVVL
jgi:hypothetical protein